MFSNRLQVPINGGRGGISRINLKPVTALINMWSPSISTYHLNTGITIVIITKSNCHECSHDINKHAQDCMLNSAIIKRYFYGHCVCYYHPLHDCIDVLVTCTNIGSSDCTNIIPLMDMAYSMCCMMTQARDRYYRDQNGNCRRCGESIVEEILFHFHLKGPGVLRPQYPTSNYSSIYSK